KGLLGRADDLQAGVDRLLDAPLKLRGIKAAAFALQRDGDDNGRFPGTIWFAGELPRRLIDAQPFRAFLNAEPRLLDVPVIHHLASIHDAGSRVADRAN